MKPQDPQQEGPILRPHEYDGIKEYDQKLPNWWLATWYITMVWFVLAWAAYYQLGWGRSPTAEVEASLAKIAEVQQQALQNITDEKLWDMSRDPKVVAAGQATYATTCVACHGPDLSGKLAGAKLPGLPLMDQEWKHGHEPVKLLNIIRRGAPDVTKGMPPWEPQLGLQRVTEVLAFILSKHQQGEPFTLAADSPLRTQRQ